MANTMHETAELIANLITILVFVFAPLWLAYRHFNNCLAVRGEDYRGLQESLAIGGTWAQRYRRLLNRRLDWLDSHLLDRGGGEPRGLFTWPFGYNPWSAKSFEICFRLAVAYPVLSLFLIWLVWGENTSGVALLLPEDPPAWRRGLALLGFGLSGFAFFRSLRSDGWRSVIWLLLAGATAAAAAVASAGAFAAAGAGAAAAAGAAAVAFAAAFAGAAAGAAAGVSAGAFAGAAAGAAAGAVAGAGTVVVAVVVAGVGAGAISWLYWVVRQFRGVPLFYTIFIPALLVAAALLVEFAPSGDDSRPVFVLLLIYLAVLPVINGVFDWLSLGFTRGLLQWAASRAWSMRWVIVTSLADLLASVVFLTALALSMTAMLAVLNLRAASSTGTSLVDLPSLFARLRHNPWDPALLWVHFTLFSTFLPTLAHLGILVSAATIVHLPGRVRILDLMDQGVDKNHGRRLQVVLWFVAQRSITFVAPVAFLLLILFLLWLYLPGLGGWLLYLCEWLNWSITGDGGAKPVPPTGLLLDA